MIEHGISCAVFITPERNNDIFVAYVVLQIFEMINVLR